MSLRRNIGTGSLFRHPGCKRWIIQYYVDGRRIRESTGLENKRKAQDLLTERLGQVSRGELVPREQRRARVQDLFLALEEYTKVNRPKSLKDLRGRWKHLTLYSLSCPRRRSPQIASHGMRGCARKKGLPTPRSIANLPRSVVR